MRKRQKLFEKQIDEARDKMFPMPKGYWEAMPVNAPWRPHLYVGTPQPSSKVIAATGATPKHSSLVAPQRAASSGETAPEG